MRSAHSMTTPAASPLTKTVLPAPSAPLSRSVSPPASLSPTRRPASNVSSGEEEISSPDSKVSPAVTLKPSPLPRSSPLRPRSRSLSFRVERAHGRAQVNPYVRRDHRAHSFFARGQIAREPRHVDGRDDGRDGVRIAFERAVALREESRDDARQRVDRAGRAEA